MTFINPDTDAVLYFQKKVVYLAALFLRERGIPITNSSMRDVLTDDRFVENTFSKTEQDFYFRIIATLLLAVDQ